MNFSPDQRAVLTALADVLIPAAGDLPSASQAEVAGRWLDAVLAARPDLVTGLAELLRLAGNRDASLVVGEWRANQAAAFSTLTEIVSGAYFMNPDVQRAIGYNGQGPQPIDPRPDYMEDDLLASVIRRGPIFRPTPR